MDENQQNADMDSVKSGLSNLTDRADMTFDRVKKIKQHSFYNKADFEDTIETLKDRYEELAHSVSEHRKQGVDVSIPAMMLRNVHPKIVYFQVSQNNADHENIVSLLDDIEEEIKYAQGVKNKDLKEEIMHELGTNIKKED